MIEYPDGPCEAWAERLHALQADALSETERREVQAHLDECPACAAALIVSQEVASLIQRLPWRAMPSGLPPQLLQEWTQAGMTEQSMPAEAQLFPGARAATPPPESVRGQHVYSSNLPTDSEGTTAPAPSSAGARLQRRAVPLPAPQHPALRPPTRIHWVRRGAAVLIVILVILAAMLGLIASHRHAGSPTGSPGSGLRWIQLHPTGGPPPPRGPGANGAVGYDVTHNRLLFFGGLTREDVSLNDTWVLLNADGTTGTPQWVQLATRNTPAPHKGQAGAYDAATNRLMVYGGCLGQCTPLDSGVYVLTNANGLGGTPTWQQLHPTSSPPPDRTSFTAVYDDSSNRLIIFGGEDTLGARYNDTWVLTHANGLGGAPAWIHLTPSDDPPPARKFHAAVYLPATNQMLIYGGDSRASPWLNDLWVLNNANGLGGPPVWSQLTPGSAVPAARVTPALIYDQARNQLLLYGGSHPGGTLGDSWTLANTDGLSGIPEWQQLAPSGALPVPRDSPLVAYSPASQRLMVFGGADSSGTLLSDLWVLALAG